MVKLSLSLSLSLFLSLCVSLLPYLRPAENKVAAVLSKRRETRHRLRVAREDDLAASGPQVPHSHLAIFSPVFISVLIFDGIVLTSSSFSITAQRNLMDCMHKKNDRFDFDCQQPRAGQLIPTLHDLYSHRYFAADRFVITYVLLCMIRQHKGSCCCSCVVVVVAAAATTGDHIK